MDIMLAMVDRPEHKFNVDRADGVSRRHKVGMEINRAVVMERESGSSHQSQLLHQRELVGYGPLFDDFPVHDAMHGDLRSRYLGTRRLETVHLALERAA